MKTVYVVLSPKKKWSNSAYLAAVSHPFAGSDSMTIHYRGPKDVESIMEQLRKGCRLVLVMPLFVDGIPSHVLELMEKIEQQTKQERLHSEVYSMINCGFYEGQQCEYALEMVECWCLRCGFQFMGGRGIGAGEMFGVLRLNLLIGALLIAADFAINLVKAAFSGAFSMSLVLSGMHPLSGIITIALGILWSLGPWFAAAKVGSCAKKGIQCGVRYTTVTCCPSILFAFFASLYWVLRALLMHRIPIWTLFKKIDE